MPDKSIIVLLFLFLHCFFVADVHSAPSIHEEEDDSNEEHSEEHHPAKPHGKGHWRYDDQNTWSSDFEHCNGKSQSPINIDTTTAKYDTRLPAIELQGYELSAEDKLSLKNNGHTLLLNLPNTMRIIRGFDNEFVAAQLHFHWGTKEVPGSEHTVDGLRFPAEIHVVHYNSKYENLGEAASQPDGLAVLGAFLEIGRQENAEYNNILSSLADVSSEESDIEIDGFNIRFLLPSNLERFFRYNGSLTTPPCFQTVNWTVFNDTIKVSRKQMAALEETLKIGQNELLTKNFRAPQLLFGREVLSSFKMSSDISPNGFSKGSRRFSENGTPNNGIEANREDSSSVDKMSDEKDFGLGSILAIVFGALFVVTLLAFIIYMAQQRKKISRLEKDSRQNVIYKPAASAEVQ
ncbi:carbonic anhydrase 14 isoform X2 [Erpetoichthys calabaricus]|uniref:carbonic anhydrase 14 isoform X2 n=1 Tax=Erpetoichthys calabaricus TaxID=27687 RepID=UPI00109F1C82|nr:carbonic anhydrase 14 isoform X2 [Erpetoichthys calabaricus]